MIQYQARIFKDGNNYSVIFPDLPGVVSQGGDRVAARRNAREALDLFLEESRDPKWEVPMAKNRKGRQYEWISASPEIAIPLMIRAARRKLGLSQKELAERLGISFQQLQKLECPGKSNPTVKTLKAISEALNGEIDIKLVA